MNGREVEEAIKLSRENPGLDIGLHITLTQESPIELSSNIKSLLNAEGKFYKDIFEFLIKYAIGQIKIGDIRKEIEAQFKKIFSFGIKVSHVDSHQYVHSLPGISEVVLELCKKYNINFIRSPYCPMRCVDILKGRRFIQQVFINILSLSMAKKIKVYNLKSCDVCFGSLYSGDMDENCFKGIVRMLKDGLSEIICHPAIIDDDLLARYGYWNYNWKKEYDVLTSAQTVDYLNRYLAHIYDFNKS